MSNEVNEKRVATLSPPSNQVIGKLTEKLTSSNITSTKILVSFYNYIVDQKFFKASIDYRYLIGPYWRYFGLLA